MLPSPRACASLGERRGRCLLVFPDGLTGNSTVLLAARRRSALPLAADHRRRHRRRSGAVRSHLPVSRRPRALSDAVTAVLIGGDVDVETTVSHGCEPIGSVRTVTRSDGGTVYEIDGRSAWSVFKEYLDGDPVDLSAADSVHLSFGERLPARDERRLRRVRHAHAVRRSTARAARSSFPGSLAQGAKIQMTRRDPDRIRRSATTSARELAARRSRRAPAPGAALRLRRSRPHHLRRARDRDGDHPDPGGARPRPAVARLPHLRRDRAARRRPPTTTTTRSCSLALYDRERADGSQPSSSA